MATKIHSGQIVGLKGFPIEVEIDMVPGLHRLSIVGLPDKAVEEARERVSAAIKNSGFRPPQKKNNRITVNLAPADLPKEGAFFDVPIALAYLAESGQIKFAPEKKFFVGELALEGSTRPVRGVVSLLLSARENGFDEAYVPEGNLEEASLVGGITIYAIKHFSDITKHLMGEHTLEPVRQKMFSPKTENPELDLRDIKGQEFAKRGLEIAAAGNHHVAFIGPPGTGKTLLARALASILPPLSFEEALDITSIHSAAGVLRGGVVRERPFRSPHHTSSYVSLVGGGTIPRPGEVTLAHGGVLFLDEFPEFDRRVIETLRQPLEDRMISISRAKGSMTFPAHIMLAAAMNPCPCGNKGSTKICTCSNSALERYARRLSGPIVDRIDMWLEMPQVEYEKLASDTEAGETSAAVRERVTLARNAQRVRFGEVQFATNSEMTLRDIKTHCALGETEKKLLEDASKRLDLSARAYHRVLKVSRTIADLAGTKNIGREHLLEALQYRPKKDLFLS
ncbi:MAG: YifB family Mg chelatase-like AAA ATPase [Patescibacteria group bacterium]